MGYRLEAQNQVLGEESIALARGGCAWQRVILWVVVADFDPVRKMMMAMTMLQPKDPNCWEMLVSKRARSGLDCGDGGTASLSGNQQLRKGGCGWPQERK